MFEAPFPFPHRFVITSKFPLNRRLSFPIPPAKNRNPSSRKLERYESRGVRYLFCFSVKACFQEACFQEVLNILDYPNAKNTRRKIRQIRICSSNLGDHLAFYVISLRIHRQC